MAALHLRLPSSRAPMIADSSIGHAPCRTSPEEPSLSCQELCNAADPKSTESENGQCVVGQAPRTEPARSDVQDRIVPLSGNPYFTVIVGKSQIHKPFQLLIPWNFYKFLPHASVPVVLSCQNKSWEVRYSGHRSIKRLCRGFREFVIDNVLELGDGCVYELMDREKLEFRVQILRGKIPSKFANGTSGQSIDSPVMID